MGSAPRRVREAMAVVDRRFFLPASQARYAHVDMPLPIGHHATCSQPSTVEAMLQLLDPRPGEKVLDIGSGSAWTTAILAYLVGSDGSVLGVELEQPLVADGRENLLTWQEYVESQGSPRPPARIEQAVPRRLGWPSEAPFDRILVSADAHCVPQSLVEQLADAGRMVLPVRGRMAVIDKIGGEVKVREFGNFSFVPLRETGEPGEQVD